MRASTMVTGVPLLSFRPIAPEDEPFLYRVYASTREDELAQVGWDDAQQAEFLGMQFLAQHTYYLEQFPDASFQIILFDGQPAGRLYLDRRPDEIRIIDIALLPDFRNMGLGTRLLQDIQTESAAASKPVRIHVEGYNPALRLYRRLGFRQIGDTGVYYLMAWSPASHEDDDPDRRDNGGNERC